MLSCALRTQRLMGHWPCRQEAPNSVKAGKPGKPVVIPGGGGDSGCNKEHIINVWMLGTRETGGGGRGGAVRIRQDHVKP